MTSFKTAALAAAAPARAAKLKFASLAPEGTDALKVMKEIDVVHLTCRGHS